MQSYDPARAAELLTSIEAALADLAHIDRVVDARDEFYAAHPGMSDPFGIGEDLLGTDIPVGTRYSFEIAVYGAARSWHASNVGWRTEAEAWARQCVDEFREATTFVTRVDSHAFLSVVNSLQAGVVDLSVTVPTSLENDVLRPLEDQWRGTARDSFKTFVAHAITATTHQGWLLEAIRVSLTQAKAVVDMAQLEIMHLLQSVSDGLDAQLRKRVEEERGSELLIALFLFASTATGVLGSIALPSALASASSVMAVASPLLGAAKDVVPQNDVNLRDVPVHRAVHYADHLASSTRAILDDDRTRWERAHAYGAGEIRERIASLGDSHGHRAFVPPMPSMADGPVAPDDFAPVAP